MPMHDWTIVSPGTYHGFHTAWITEIARALNNGILPESFYAESEQIAGQTGPDVLALEVESNSAISSITVDRVGGGVATVTETLPKVSIMQTASEAEVYSERRNLLAIRHTSGDRLVAYIELMSSGNKSSRRMLERFLDKACSVIEQDVHLLIVDPYPPGTFDPQGIHGAIWNEIDPSSPFLFPDDRHLTAVSYHAVHPPVAFVEPMGVGLSLPVMPLFLDHQRYVNLPLESAYMQALPAVPKHYRNQLIESINSGDSSTR